MALTDLVLDALATYRLTRLVTRDTITAEPRERFVRHEYAHAGDVTAAEQLLNDEPAAGACWVEQVDADGARAPKLAKLVTCPWCASIYVAAGVVLARRLAPRAWDPLARLLSFAAVAGLVALHEEPAPTVELSTLEPVRYSWPAREENLGEGGIVEVHTASQCVGGACSEGHTYQPGCLLAQ